MSSPADAQLFWVQRCASARDAYMIARHAYTICALHKALAFASNARREAFPDVAAAARPPARAASATASMFLELAAAKSASSSAATRSCGRPHSHGLRVGAEQQGRWRLRTVAEPRGEPIFKESSRAVSSCCAGVRRDFLTGQP